MARAVLPRIALTLLSLASASCILDATIGRDDPESGGGGEGGAFTDGAESSSSAGTAGGGEGGAGGGEGEGEGGETRGGEESTGAADTESDMLPPLCHPTDADNECAQCRKTHCCDQIIHCHDAPGCFCYWDCFVHAEVTVEECAAHCDYDGAAFLEVVACQHDSVHPTMRRRGTDRPTAAGHPGRLSKGRFRGKFRGRFRSRFGSRSRFSGRLRKLRAVVGGGVTPRPRSRKARGSLVPTRAR